MNFNTEQNVMQVEEIKREKNKEIMLGDDNSLNETTKLKQTVILATIIVAIFTFLYSIPNDHGIVNKLSPIRKLDSRSEHLTKQERCTFVVLCGTGDVDTVKEMHSLLVSAILLTSCPLHFVFITDNKGVAPIEELFTANTSFKKDISVDIWTISLSFIEKWANSFKFDVHGALEKKRIWLTAKLFVPWLLRDSFDRVVVIDSDMIFLDDPALLWKQFQSDKDKNWAFKMPLGRAMGMNTICSCVVLINIRNAVLFNAYPNKFFNALNRHASKYYNKTSGLFRTVRVDQAVYFVLYKTYTSSFRSLNPQFNVDYCSGYQKAFDKDSNKRISLLHKNCESSKRMYKEEGDVFFAFYQSYKWSWLKSDCSNGHAVRVNKFKQSTSLHKIRYVNS